jgi:predicted porin
MYGPLSNQAIGEEEMKKLFTTAAAAALTSLSAHAQTNTTVYGIVDAGVEAINHTTAASGTTWRQVSGAAQSSRFGFRGSEDLGGGLKALFQLEGGFDADTGMSGQGGRLFGRSAFVGLENRLGRLTLGRLTTTIYDFDLIYDPVAPSRYSGASIDPAFAGRADNGVKYNGTFGAANMSALYSTGAEIAGASRVGREYGFGAGFKLANVNIGLAYDNLAGAMVATKGTTVKRTSIAAIFDASVVKLFAGYTHRENEVTPTASTVGEYWVGLQAPLTASTNLSAAYYGVNVHASGNDSSMLAALLSHAFSKRTDIYLHMAYARNKGNAGLGVTGFGTVAAGQNQSAATLGVRHKF